MQTPAQEREGRLVAVKACAGGSRTGVQRMPLWTLVYTRRQSAVQHATRTELDIRPMQVLYTIDTQRPFSIESAFIGAACP